MSRGKLWTGFLGLGLAGVAATANPRCRPMELGDIVLPPLPGPVEPAPKPVAPVPKPTAPVELPPPVALAPTVPLPDLAIPPALPSAGTPSPMLELPSAIKLAPPVPAPVAIAPADFAVPPAASPVPTGELTLPSIGKPVDVAPSSPPPIKLETPPAASPPGVTLPKESVPPIPAAKPETAVKLDLKLGRPRLEVRNGEEVVLKVCADKLDVRGPSEKGEPSNVLKAAGLVSFTTPGCRGTCDDLTVFPKTGEVILAGNITMTCREGKGETVLTADVLKFKVAAATSVTLPEPPAVVPVSLKK